MSWLQKIAQPTQLWHGTSEHYDDIRRSGLIPTERTGTVFLTDYPDLALNYAVTDQERTGNGWALLIAVNVSALDESKLLADWDHSSIDNWIDSLKENDQCEYQGHIPFSAISHMTIYYDDGRILEL